MDTKILICKWMKNIVGLSFPKWYKEEIGFRHTHVMIDVGERVSSFPSEGAFSFSVFVESAQLLILE